MIRGNLVAMFLVATLGTTFAAVAATDKAADTSETNRATTKIMDRGALQRLENNQGLTLQWISWQQRGRLTVTETGALVRLVGSQQEMSGPGRMTLDGVVLAIDRDTFTFRGKIAIYNAPHDRKECLRDGTFEFRATGTRHYWRLQEMSSCGPDATDYVDVYFKP